MFKQNINKKLISFFILLISLIIFINIKETNKNVVLTIILWYENILPTVPLSYFLGNLLYYYNNLLLLVYPFFKKFFSFENKNEFILFIISFIVGNPTSTILIIDAYENKGISLNSTKRLLKYSSFVSIFFILFVLPPSISFPLLIGQFLSSFIINKINRSITTNEVISDYNISITKLIERLPVVLLNILSTMVFTTIIKTPIKLIFPKSIYFIPTILAFLEITQGLNELFSLYSNIILLFFSSLLVSFHGIAIIIQITTLLKQKMLNIKSYLKYRLIHAFLATLFSILFYLFFKFFF